MKNNVFFTISLIFSGVLCLPSETFFTESGKNDNGTVIDLPLSCQQKHNLHAVDIIVKGIEQVAIM